MYQRRIDKFWKASDRPKDQYTCCSPVSTGVIANAYALLTALEFCEHTTNCNYLVTNAVVQEQ